MSIKQQKILQQNEGTTVFMFACTFDMCIKLLLNSIHMPDMVYTIYKFI